MDKELVSFNYPEGDFHERYVGEMLHAYQKEQDAEMTNEDFSAPSNFFTCT